MSYLVCRVEDANGTTYTTRAHFINNRIECTPDVVYIRGRYINRGRNGTVYECWREAGSSNDLFAVKFLTVLTPPRVARFDFENAVLSELSHPNVLPLHDAGEVETTLGATRVPFLITSRMKTNLEWQVKTDGPLTMERIKSYAMQMCDGFSYVHEQGIIHRDVKPGNFLLNYDDNVIIGDFGLAKTATDEGVARFYRDDITLNHEIVGPQAFMSPELYRYARDKSYPVDHRSDLYQIGAVLWYLATGFPPVGFIDEQDDPSGGALHRVVKRCMKARPDDRVQTAEELKQAISTI